jgi:hypothetical protein
MMLWMVTLSVFVVALVVLVFYLCERIDTVAGNAGAALNKAREAMEQSEDKRLKKFIDHWWSGNHSLFHMQVLPYDGEERKILSRLEQRDARIKSLEDSLGLVYDDGTVAMPSHRKKAAKKKA